MTKELQDHVWKHCLPKEFKEEVKRMYRIADSDVDQMIATIMLENVFGLHNLTSDAEGEEMLTVSRKEVQKLYGDYCTERDKEEPGSNRSSLGGRIAMLQELFGSKCLPDEACNVASSDVASNVTSSEPKPAEPKFKVGDEAFYVCSPTLKHKCTVTKVMQNEHSGKWEYNVMFEWGKPGMWIPESDLEPYTEPTENLKPSNSGELESQEANNQSRNLSQSMSNCDKSFDKILKDSFHNHNRLHIAAMCLQGMLSAGDYSGCPDSAWSELAKIALACADALIKEAQKGGEQ